MKKLLCVVIITKSFDFNNKVLESLSQIESRSASSHAASAPVEKSSMTDDLKDLMRHLT